MHDSITELIQDAGGESADPGLIITNMAAALDRLDARLSSPEAYVSDGEVSQVIREVAEVLRQQANRLPV